ncbi:MAG: TRAP transporter small permease [Geminicoccaceae bacterium]
MSAASEKIDRAINRLAFAMAMAGGVVLTALMVMTVISIGGRSLVWAGLGPIPGDFELVEVGTAFAVSAFLPWCQLQKGHVTVDIVLAKAGARLNSAIDVFAHALMTAVAGLLTWRLFLGLMDKARYGETSFILQFPVWWGYAGCFVGLCCFVLVSAWTAFQSFSGLRQRAGATDRQ